MYDDVNKEIKHQVPTLLVLIKQAYIRCVGLESDLGSQERRMLH